MMLTFNSKTYGELLAHYQPKAITTEVENERVIAIAQELEHRSELSLEEEALLELLISLIERFEADNYPIPDRNPLATLQHLIEANEIEYPELITILGSPDAVEQIINGQRSINQSEARSLGSYFRVDASLFT
ncbi:MAG: transcriptional regulator [Microcystis aeruginosa Ma_QC_Ca_00000000_S207]|jgi:HTH-type transcriptional regulator/antitoxin HigA|uniref:Transcriptional regulator n=3 Tax=Microcystis TaxID=1125 RepID=A0A552FS16_MICAE|nr:MULTISPECIES: transcriptional regulator [unclassified Microcystis]MCU7241976.1 transcriptional regulator [Microcystis aeruginosa WS75]NCQ68142.1 transcriptional regulator [Microcystis aeruginosa W13-16]NCQ72450.1 transcriptional regulator [Microcystis aeruginosa W13-13]NCQ77110.1 transcriptional regulator [Microcystis aeruginosa W13-15]NCR11884.1 transcriptional regulator [Microcystis aeruginosa SX13-11]NCR16292.1 transcriptional regulator [Microcystis aeruginosa LL13-03]NCR20681.1 transc